MHIHSVVYNTLKLSLTYFSFSIVTFKGNAYFSIASSAEALILQNLGIEPSLLL